MTSDWMKQLSDKKNNDEFSQLCHNYFKLTIMRIMQEMREKYNVPKEEIRSLTLVIFGKILNEAVYSIGANIKSDYPITRFYSKEQLLNIIRLLSGEPLDQNERTDIETDLEKGLSKFKNFILENASDF